MGGQSIVYVYNIDGLFFSLRLFTRGGWVVQKGQNSVDVVVEWPLLPSELPVRCYFWTFLVARLFAKVPESQTIMRKNCNKNLSSKNWVKNKKWSKISN